MTKNIILIHGWGASVEKLKPLEKELKKLGWSTCAIKLPGFDLSPPIKPWSLNDYVDYVTKVGEKEFGDSKYFLFGHSFGGRVAIKFSKDQTRSNVLNAVILCSAGGISRGNIVKRKIFCIMAKVGKVFNIIPKAADLFKKIIYKAAREHDYENAEGVMKKTFVKIVKEELKDGLEKIKLPIFIIWGKDDKVTPVKDAYYLSKNIKNSKLKIYKGKTHNIPYVEFIKIAKDIDNWASDLKL